MLNKYDIIIAGAGIAGISAIKAIRENEKNKSVLLINNEDRLPYKRTKINKTLVTGFKKNDFALFPREWYQQMNVDLLTTQITDIHPEIKKITTDGAREIYYENLLLATGSKAAHPIIKGLTINNFHTLRSAFDSEKLLENIQEKKSFLIIGGGVEGMEVADQLIKMNKQVFLLHRHSQLMHQHLPRRLSALLKKEAEAKGLHLFLPGNPPYITKDNNQFIIKTSKQNWIVDGLIACTGTLPNIELAQKANLNISTGICINQYLQTSNKHIFAAGDCAQFPNTSPSGLWHAAEHQGYAAGKNLLGESIPYNHQPSRLKTEVFDQFFFSLNPGLKVQSNTTTTFEVSAEKMREIYTRNSIIKGVTMCNDKTNAKIYQQAVWEGWTLTRLQEQLRF